MSSGAGRREPLRSSAAAGPAGRTVRVTHAVTLPDPLRVARCRRAPELGPKLCFFSGGTALRELCRWLKLRTHNSIHLITPFDSGGSSAGLRRAFGMLSVGDLRNRLMALADETTRGNPSMYALVSHRLPADAPPAALAAELDSLVDGTHPLVAAVPKPLSRLVRTHLRMFVEAMPPSFDLSGASVGNLMLAGGYLNNERDIHSVLFLFSQLVEVRGHVEPVVDADLHLRAELADGRVLVGQHTLTGKEVAPLTSPIAALSLVEGLEDPWPASVRCGDEVLRHIGGADLIVFPMGSFYTSVLANLLPEGVGRAVRSAPCPKVYVPSTGVDPEAVGLSVGAAVERLVQTLRADAGADAPASELVGFVLVDPSAEAYAGPLELERVAALGIEVVEVPLVSESSAPHIDPEWLGAVLLSLA